MLAVVPQPTFRSLPLRAPDRRARRCTEPSLGADRPSPEHKPAAAPRLLSRTRPSGEVVPRAQARVVQREVRDRRITARGVKPNALALLGRSCPPTTPHRFLLVGGSRRCVMTSITWIGMTTCLYAQESCRVAPKGILQVCVQPLLRHHALLQIRRVTLHVHYVFLGIVSWTLAITLRSRASL